MPASTRTESAFAKLPDLTAGANNDVAKTFEQFAKGLETSGLRGTVQFVVSEGGNSKTFAVKLGKGAKSAAPKAGALPELEILVEAGTWWSIARGEISPLDALTTGRMRVRGTNIRLGPLVLAHFAGGHGRTDIC